jgi:DNA/RNA endonuclease YhcR with UshA esterase domain
LNLDQPYPKEIFTILIWGSDRSKFNVPEKEFKDVKVCVTGRIQIYRGNAEIIATDSSQIQLQR